MRAVTLVMALGMAGCSGLLGFDDTYEISECAVCGVDACVDLTRDPMHCGECDRACPDGDVCTAGECGQVVGCEPGAEEPCYTGAEGTEGQGVCVGGTRTCDDDGVWSACVGEVTPSAEACGNGVDEDCNGTPDDEHDFDGDGYTNCANDCCDATAEGCPEPAMINPSAIELAGNGLDDDCDAMVDNAATSVCDETLASDSVSGTDFARALDLCVDASEDGRAWGLITATLGPATGIFPPKPAQHAIRAEFGATTVQHGNAMIVLSTGHAATPTQTAPAPGPGTHEQGVDHMNQATPPFDWLAANGNQIPTPAGCPAPSSTNANDSVMLTLRLRAPSNARSFSLRTNFMTAEYPEWICSAFSDVLLVLLDSTWAGTPANPTDKNLATVTTDTARSLMNVNLARDTDLFRVCNNAAAPCPVPTTSCLGTDELVGTGFDTTEPNVCGQMVPGISAGASGWLVTQGNVVGGEIITLRIVIFDVSDGIIDSTALLDAFTWSPDVVEPGTFLE